MAAFPRIHTQRMLERFWRSPRVTALPSHRSCSWVWAMAPRRMFMGNSLGSTTIRSPVNEAYFKKVDAVLRDRPRQRPGHFDDDLPSALPQLHHDQECPAWAKWVRAPISGCAHTGLVHDTRSQTGVRSDSAGTGGRSSRRRRRCTLDYLQAGPRRFPPALFTAKSGWTSIPCKPGRQSSWSIRW